MSKNIKNQFMYELAEELMQKFNIEISKKL